MDERSVDALIPWLRLCRLPSVCNRTRLALLEHFGDVKKIFACAEEGSRLGDHERLLKKIHAAKQFDLSQDVNWLCQRDCHLLPITDPQYPLLLREISDPPVMLFVKGATAALELPAVAIVGSRNPSPSGLATAASFAQELCAHRFAVVSGLALGIDGAAHRATLENDGITIAVAATGLDRVYPKSHEAMAEQISEIGALISEFPLGTAPRREYFPQRNRIVSGLTLGTLVIEATARSGSLITARFAGEQGREVFAVPGSILSPLSRGCHRLLKDGAKLVETIDDVLDELPKTTRHADLTDPSPAAGDVYDPQERQLLDCLGYSPTRIDTLIECSGLTAATVCSMLLKMELRGVVAVAPGGAYMRVH